MSVEFVLAIDFGNSFSRAALVSENGTQLVSNEFEKTFTPSCLSFEDNGDNVLVGEPALVQLLNSDSPTALDSTLYDIRRIAGLPPSQLTHHLPPSSGEPSDATRLESTFPLFDRSDIPSFEVEFQGSLQTFRVEELIAVILRKLKCDAEKQVGQSVTKAVLSVPAHFGSRQRQAIKDAGMIAGLTVLRLLNDTTAAVLGYDVVTHPEPQSREVLGNRIVLVVDFGGGKLDVTLFEVEDGVYEVLATCGGNLGGMDVDLRLVEYFAAEFHKRHGADLRRSRVALTRLRTACTRLKMELSEHPRARIEIEGLFENVDFVSQLSRSKFEQICAEDFNTVISYVGRVLTEGGRSKEQIHNVILVGGCSRIPMIQRMLRDFFDGKQLSIPLNSEEFVVRGVAVQAGILTGTVADDVLLLDVMSESLGVFPDGIDAPSFFHRNVTIPSRKSIVLSTSEDNQPALVVPIQGDKKKTVTKDSPVIANFRLSGLAPMPAGTTSVEVTLNVDSNAILFASACILSYRDSLFQRLSWTLPQMCAEEIEEACLRLRGLLPDATDRREMFL